MKKCVDPHVVSSASLTSFGAIQKERLRQKALDLGFDVVGFASVEAFEHASYLKKWLEQERYGDMTWMAHHTEKRKSIAALMPEARSSVVVGLNYHRFWNLEKVAPGSFLGTVARYARGRDYHRVIEKILQQLSRILCQECGQDTVNRWYVDTGPVLERELAARAGIGWQGKSTVVLSKKFGTWLLLAEVLTSAAFEPDSPAKDHCGNCMRCIEACPTGAITSAHELDATRCIAYLTIELKGSIPEKYRKAIGDRVFGCDDCLAVCPWNRFAQESNALKNHQRVDLARLDLVEIMRMDDRSFAEKFSQTPIKRLGLNRLKRNSAVVLGNLGNQKALPVLEEAIRTGDDLVKEHAQWAIRQIESRIS